MGQKGLCHISKKRLNLRAMVLRNKVPKEKGGYRQISQSYIGKQGNWCNDRRK